MPATEIHLRMMEERMEYVGVIKDKTLDDFLSLGWYRQGFMIFTAHFIAPLPDNKLYRAYWLRYKTQEVKLSKKSQNLLAANSHFTVSCRPFQMNEEILGLHKKYAACLKFTANHNLTEILLDTTNQIFDSNIIEVRHEGKLIAAGIFDKGSTSIAGIINFYDPEYKKHSLGRYLILQKHLYCIAHKVALYYPGYYTPAHPLFDYKLFLDKNATEVFIPEIGDWVGFSPFTGKQAV